ncbi:MAG: hypothetical protein AB7O65_07795 [Candidatus Korobacteraceae bacterium]
MRTVSAVVLATLLAVMSYAHGGSKHIMGTVKEIRSDTIAVQTRESKMVTVTFDAQTKFQKSGVAADVKQLKVGERVVIDVPEQGDAKATRIQFGAPPKPAPHAGHGNEHRE